MELVAKAKPYKAAGISGWTNLLIKELMPNRLLVLIMRLMMLNRVPPVSKELLTGIRGLPFLKPESERKRDIRPVEIPCCLVRLTCRWLLEKLPPDRLVEVLGVANFSVKVGGGAETLVHVARAALENKLSFLKLDVSNAYNTALRSKMFELMKAKLPTLYGMMCFMYGGHHDILVEAEDGHVEVIPSTEGLHQGGVFASIAFTLLFKEVLEAWEAGPLAEIGYNTKLSAYIDDVGCVLPSAHPDEGEVSDMLDKMQKIALPYGLQLDLRKCKVLKPDRLQQPDEQAVRYLGGYLGHDDSVVTALRAKTEKWTSALTKAVRTLPQQHALLLIRGCLANNANYLLRTHPTHIVLQAMEEFDAAILGAVKRMAHVDSEEWDKLRREVSARYDETRAELLGAIAGLPPSMGGLGIASAKATAPYAYAASIVMAEAVLVDKYGALMGPETLGVDLRWTRGAEGAALLGEKLLLAPGDEPEARPRSNDVRQLQHLMMEPIHHYTQLKVFNTLADSPHKSDQDRATRFVERISSVLSRQWMHLGPTAPVQRLSDFEVMVGLRVALMLSLIPQDGEYPTGGRCMCCTNHPGTEAMDMHVVTCGRGRRQMAKIGRHNAIAALVLQAHRRYGGSRVELGTGTMSSQEWSKFEMEQRLATDSAARARSDVLVTKGDNILHIDVSVQALNPKAEWWRALKQEAALAHQNAEYVLTFVDIAKRLGTRQRTLDKDCRKQDDAVVKKRIKRKLAEEGVRNAPPCLARVREMANERRRKEASIHQPVGEEQPQADEDDAAAGDVVGNQHVKAITYYLSRLTYTLRSKLNGTFKRKESKMIKFVRRDQQAPFVLSAFGMQHRLNAKALPYPLPGTPEYNARMKGTVFGKSKDFIARDAMRKLISLRLLKALAQSVRLGQGRAVRWRHQREVETQLDLAPAWEGE